MNAELRKTPRAQVVRVTWTDGTDADATGYEIERTEDGGSNWSQVHTGAMGEQTWDDTTLTAGATYRYRVRHTGDSIDPSAWAESNDVTIPGGGDQPATGYFLWAGKDDDSYLAAGDVVAAPGDEVLKITDASADARDLTVVAVDGGPTKADLGATYSYNRAIQMGASEFGSPLSQPIDIFIAVPSMMEVTGHIRKFFDALTDAFSVQIEDVAGNIRFYSGQWADTAFVLPDTGPHVYHFLFNGAASKLYVDGEEKATVDPGAAALDGFTLGSQRTLDARPFRGDIADVLIYAKGAPLDEAERQQTTQYLMNKYGLNGPADNYKLWYGKDDDSYLKADSTPAADGEEVATIVDSGPGGFNMAAIDAPPTRSANGVYTDRGGYYRVDPVDRIDEPFDAFVVFQSDAVTSLRYAWAGTNASNVRLEHLETEILRYWGGQAVDGATINTSVHIAHVHADGANTTLSVDGVEVGSGDSGTRAILSQAILCKEADDISDWQGQVGDVIVYASADIDDDGIQRTTQYLMNKHGVSRGLLLAAPAITQAEYVTLDNAVTIAWSAAPAEAEGYTVMRSGNADMSGAVEIASGPASELSIQDAPPAGSYYYCVRFTNGSHPNVLAKMAHTGEIVVS